MSTSDAEKAMSQTRRMFGRRAIKTSAKSITAENVLDVLGKALAVHAANRSEINYLWNYYKGDQPVLYRTKEGRPEICNKVVENRANEIVSFKVGYLCGEPIQYVGKNTDPGVTEKIMKLNDLMSEEDKASKDQELVEWGMICGTAYMLVLPDNAAEKDDAPFELYVLDPRDTFIVYSNEVGNKPLMGVKYAQDENGVTRYSIYTEDHYYLVEDSIINVAESKPHALGMVPIFEYPANNARLGSFEVVLPLLDAINTLESNRLDGVEQFIQAFWKFIGCKMDEGDFNKFLERGAIMVPPNDTGGNIDVDLVTKELNQQQTQMLKEDLHKSVLAIAGVPNQSGGASTSDTGQAVLLREGWSRAEALAKDYEHIFKRSDKPMRKLVLRICRDLIGLDLKSKDIDPHFTRRNYDNIQSKSQVLVEMLNQPMIHPLLAFQHSGLFVDPESAYDMSMKYYEQEQAKQQAQPSPPEIPPSSGERK